MILNVFVFVCSTLALVNSDSVSQSNAYVVRNPYDLVAKCSPAVLAIKNEGFKLEDFANKGQFVFAYTNPGPRNLLCGVVEYKEDANNTFIITNTITTNDGVTTTTSYDVSKVEKGIIYETQSVTDAAGTVTIYEFRVVVIKYDVQYGVLYYIR